MLYHTTHCRRSGGTASCWTLWTPLRLLRSRDCMLYATRAMSWVRPSSTLRRWRRSGRATMFRLGNCWWGSRGGWSISSKSACRGRWSEGRVSGLFELCLDAHSCKPLINYSIHQTKMKGKSRRRRNVTGALQSLCEGSAHILLFLRAKNVR
jgi:hypothetical protein